jgi:hypothetical protein
VLTDWVRQVAIERSRPEVFRRANELLVRFTNGTLSLDLDDRASPAAFRARRGTEPSCPVDELSIGERVQLLMAVRVAFLEEHEPARLPLLLDEALGTSDDGRAGVIIDSVIQIAAAGRQVFYFTAQRDEVGKWLARLREAGLDHRVIDLAEVRRLAAAAAGPLEIAAVELPEPPSPDGMSYEAYGRMLGVPAVDAAADSLDGLHLWHLLDDAGVLHQLLRRRIRAWGQLRTLLEHGGGGLIDGSDRALRRAGIVARALEAACRSWRIGRGRPVDRAALLDSTHVSSAFIDQLAELARDVDGDAQRLLEGLERGRVPRWRAANTERLREFFEAGGYLPEGPPLTPDEIRTRVMAAVADDLAAGRIEQPCIERIMAALPGGD